MNSTSFFNSKKLQVRFDKRLSVVFYGPRDAPSHRVDMPPDSQSTTVTGTAPIRNSIFNNKRSASQTYIPYSTLIRSEWVREFKMPKISPISLDLRVMHLEIVL